MFVLKRNGALEAINTEKIARKLKFLSEYIYPLKKVDLALLEEQVKTRIIDGISTSKIDVFCAEKCMELASLEPEYGVLSARILVHNHHRNTLNSFYDKMEKLYRRKDGEGRTVPLLNKTFYKFVRANQRHLDAIIDYKRDYLLDTFGFMTLEKQYINSIGGEFIERPQDVFMKEAIIAGMNPSNFDDEEAMETIHIIYDLLSTQKMSYATPTMNNAGMAHQQLSSCFVLSSKDSKEGINLSFDDAAEISKRGGGISINVSMWRSAGRLIRSSSNGKSSGVKNFLKFFGKGGKAYNQVGKRNGSIAIFLRDYHPDLLDFIKLKNPIGDENDRARELFLAVALSDMFWNKVKNDEEWYFVDPEQHLGLDELYGEEFERVMKKLIEEKKFEKHMPARAVLIEIMKQQFESGVPYIFNIDHANHKNNLGHYMPIRSSNLCMEIALPSTDYEYGVCNLASLVLASFVTDTPSKGNLQLLRQPVYEKNTMVNPQFDFLGLSKVTQILTRSMDRLIDRIHYPVKQAIVSNILHRPIAIGSSGLADTFCLLRVPYDSKDAITLSAGIAETISFAFYSESSKLAKELNTVKKIEDQIKDLWAIRPLHRSA